MCGIQKAHIYAPETDEEWVYYTGQYIVAQTIFGVETNLINIDGAELEIRCRSAIDVSLPLHGHDNYTKTRGGAVGVLLPP